MTQTTHISVKPASISTRYSRPWPGSTTNSASVPSALAVATTTSSRPCRLGRMLSSFLRNSWSDTKRVKASCAAPVRIRLLATR